MVFLDKEGVEQADAVVAAAADPDGIFLRCPQAGQGFAGIKQLAAATGKRRDEGAGGVGGTGQGLQKVEGGSFAGQQQAGGAAELAQHGIGSSDVAFFYAPVNTYSAMFRLGVRQLPEDLVNPSLAANDRLFPSQDAGLALPVGGYQHGGQIAPGVQCFRDRLPQVLGEGMVNRGLAFAGKVVRIKPVVHDCVVG